MVIPTVVGHLYVTHARLRQTTGHQTFPGEIVGLLLAHPVEIERRLGLFHDVENFRRLHLHPEGKLVGLDEALDIAILARLLLSTVTDGPLGGEYLSAWRSETGL